MKNLLGDFDASSSAMSSIGLRTIGTVRRHWRQTRRWGLAHETTAGFTIMKCRIEPSAEALLELARAQGIPILSTPDLTVEGMIAIQTARQRSLAS